MEGPHQLASANIECAEITWSRTVALVRGGPENQQIFEHAAGRSGLHERDGRRISTETFLEIDRTVLPERRDELAGLRVDSVKHVVC